MRTSNPTTGARFSRACVRDMVALALILVVGAGLRAAYLCDLRHDPTFTAPTTDPAFHDDWARQLIGNPGPPRPDPPVIRPPGYPLERGPGHPGNLPYMRPPAYPYLLALLYLLTGGSYVGARALQMGIGLLNALLGYFLGRKLLGRVPGLIFAGLLAGYWGFIYNEGELHAIVLLILLKLLLLLAMTAWAERPAWSRALLAGLLLGALCVAGPINLSFIPVAAVWVGWMAWKKQGAIVMRWRMPMAFLLGVVLAIAPVTIRNYRASGEFVLIMPTAGVNFFIGNRTASAGTAQYDAESFYPRDTMYIFMGFSKHLAYRLGKPIGEVRTSWHYFGQACQAVRDDPFLALGRLVKKAALFWTPLETMHNKAVQFDRKNSPVLRNLPGDFALCATLFLAGVAMFVRDRRRAVSLASSRQLDFARSASLWLVALFIMTTWLSYTAFMINSQYRAPLVPLMLLFAAYAIHRLAQLMRGRRYWAAGALLVVGAGAYALFSVNFTGYDLKTDRFIWHYDRATAYVRLGKFDRAIDEYREALRIDPSVGGAQLDLAQTLAARGRIDEAFEAVYAAYRAWPDSPLIYFGLANELIRPFVEVYDGSLARFAQPPCTFSAASMDAASQGRIALARRCLLRYLARDPEDAGVRFLANQSLGRLSLAEGRPDEAEAHLRAACEAQPRDATTRARLATALRCQGKNEEAAAFEIDAAAQATP